MSTSSHAPLSTSLISPSPRASAINSLVQEWRRQNGLPQQSSSFHYQTPTPSNPTTISSNRCSRVSAAPQPPPQQPPHSRPNTPQPSQRASPEATPQISVSDWQVEEESPALYVFLKNAAPPQASSVQERSSGDDNHHHGHDGDSHSRRNSGIDLQEPEEDKFLHGNGRTLSALDILLDEFDAIHAEMAEHAKNKWRLWTGNFMKNM